MRDLDRYLKIVVTVMDVDPADRQFAALWGGRELKGDALCAFFASGRAGNMNCVLIRPNDPKSRGFRIDDQHCPGLQSVAQRLAARYLRFGQSGDIAGK
jgi:hypothetical protein